MQVALGLDVNAGLGWADASLGQRAYQRALRIANPALGMLRQRAAAQLAASLGYESLWLPDWPGFDAFALCRQRSEASRSSRPEGIAVGTAVCPIPKYPDPLALATCASAMCEATGGRFVLGVGAGSMFYKSCEAEDTAVLSTVRDYLAALRGLFAGKPVDYAHGAVTLRGAQLAGGDHPPIPIYLAAIGPRMLRLAGELADGVVLAFCTPELIAWSRERIAEGAARAGRDPASVRVAESIPVVIDRDVDCARRTLARSVLEVALGPPLPVERRRRLGYRAQLERMGFGEALAHLDRLRESQAPRERLIDAVPQALLERVGFFGPPEQAAAALSRRHAGLDLAILRVTAARYSMESACDVISACPPHAFATAS